MEDLRRKKACFPYYDGIAYNSVINALNQKELLDTCPYTLALGKFFESICVSNFPKAEQSFINFSCNGKIYEDDLGALNCLIDGTGDVAFVSKQSFDAFMAGKLYKNLLELDYNQMISTR